MLRHVVVVAAVVSTLVAALIYEITPDVYHTTLAMIEVRGRGFLDSISPKETPGATPPEPIQAPPRIRQARKSAVPESRTSPSPIQP